MWSHISGLIRTLLLECPELAIATVRLAFERKTEMISTVQSPLHHHGCVVHESISWEQVGGEGG